jgi:hypothetical protein
VNRRRPNPRLRVYHGAGEILRRIAYGGGRVRVTLMPTETAWCPGDGVIEGPAIVCYERRGAEIIAITGEPTGSHETEET